MSESKLSICTLLSSRILQCQVLARWFSKDICVFHLICTSHLLHLKINIWTVQFVWTVQIVPCEISVVDLFLLFICFYEGGRPTSTTGQRKTINYFTLAKIINYIFKFCRRICGFWYKWNFALISITQLNSSENPMQSVAIWINQSAHRWQSMEKTVEEEREDNISPIIHDKNTWRKILGVR